MLWHYIKVSLAVMRRRPFLALVSLFGTLLTLMVLVVAVAVLDSMLSPSGAQSRQSHFLVVDTLCLRGTSFGACQSPGFAFFERHILTLRKPDKVSYSTLPAAVSSYVQSRKLTSQVRKTDVSYWQILNFSVLEGRTIAADDVAEGRRVAVINEATARSFFPQGTAVGQSIDIQSESFQIIGVVANEPETSALAYADIWVPYTAAVPADYREQWGADGVIMLFTEDPARLSGVRAELQDGLRNFIYPPDPERFSAADITMQSTLDRVAARMMGEPGEIRNDVPRFIGVSVLFAFLLMLLPAINMANLNIGRILERIPEIGLRKATGASTRALVGQFIFENLMLTFLGALCAFALAPVFLSFLNRHVYSYGALHLNIPVFLAGLSFVIVFGFLSGVYPAWRMAGIEPAAALRGRAHV